jgi:hypothetical protein
MIHNLIKTGHYLLIVDDSKIKDGDWCLEGGFIGKVYDYDNDQEFYDCWVGDSLNGYATHYDSCQKIIAHLPLNGAPVLDGVDLLPPLPTENDMMEELLDSIFGEANGSNIHIREAYRMGYNKAKEIMDTIQLPVAFECTSQQDGVWSGNYIY